MSELDRYLDDLGARLDSARVRPRPRSRLVALVVTGAVALAIALTLSLAGGGGTGEHPAVPGVGPVDAIAKASAALQVPAGQMLHMRVRSNITKPKQSLTEDLWATADPLRWRLSYTSTGGRSDQQSAYGDGISSTFVAKTNRLKRITGYTDESPQARIRTILGIGGGAGEPSDDLRAALAKGKLVDAGEVQVGGRTVRRLETKDKDDPNTLIVLIYDVDPVTFAPVGGQRIYYMPPKRRGGPRRDGPPPMRFAVETYERLPIDEAQLTIKTDAKTKVVELTQAEWMRRFRAVRRWERHCSKLRRSDPRADCGRRPASP
jgi:hypothetical protein